ncbi:MAG: rhomboid family intramembrane serine protease [Burkholderiales bacterium]|nr:rhomboid family intramembrane serine protease [Burkholderiales bacterium]
MRSPAAQVPVTTALLGANLLVFVLMLLAGAGLWHTPNGVQLAWGANFGPATQDGQWWRLFTAQFVHFGVLHLAMNMAALWDVGRLVERLYGRWRFAVLYLASGVLGNLLSLVVQGNQAVSAGASGAIFSLYGALLVFLWRERRQVEPGEFRWIFGGALLFTGLILGLGFVVPGIDNSAHGGGLLAGALLGHLLARPWTAHSPTGTAGRWSAGLAVLAALAWLVLHLPQPSYRYGEELRTRAAIADFLATDRSITQQWESLLRSGQAQGLSFEQLAGRIDERVTQRYERSFEQLQAAQPGSTVPSASQLGVLQDYAQQRLEASRELTEGLRAHDPQKIRKALQQARKAGAAVQNLPAERRSGASAAVPASGAASAAPTAEQP